MECTELGRYSFDELSVIWSKTYTDEVIKEKLQAEAERRCKETVEQLGVILGRSLVGEEGDIEEVVDNILGVMETVDEAIDLDNPYELLGHIIGGDYMIGSYPYGIQDKMGQEYLGGKICIYVEFESIDDEEMDDINDFECDMLRIIGIDVYYESLETY